MKRIFSKPKFNLVISFFIFFQIHELHSQSFFVQPPQHVHDEKCGSLYIEELQEKKLGIYGSREYFEYWVKDKIEEVQTQPLSHLKIQQGPRLIPVVVHVIHNGTAEGQGANIPTAQIESQIRILTEDYRRQNADAASTPAEFLGVAADAQIEFVLAKQDPKGLPTSGIVRVKGTKENYSPGDAGLISQTSAWPTNEYLNIWVVTLAPPFIGYSSFPTANLPGLDFPPVSQELDGVTIDYRYFGSTGNADASSQGRTTTHEVGHFLGLRHIWGDGDCSVDDFVADTPLQDSPNNVCRLFNPRFSCESRDMVENFMDYTSDACMNLFTKGQVDRIDAVLAFSPRRASLVNNRATQDPDQINNDLGFDRIVNPQDYICSTVLSPSFEVINTGLNDINSARIEIKNNGAVLQTKTFALNLSPGEISIITFNPITLASSGSNQFEANILTVNNLPDLKISNNSITSSPQLQPEINLPYAFQSSEFGNIWTVENPDNNLTWVQQSLNVSGTQQQVIMIRNYEYEGGEEQLDYFISPQFDLSQFPNAQLTFKMAHAPYDSNGLSDFLYLAVSTDCGNTFNLLQAPYNKDRDFLQTSPPTLDEFIPNNESQFRREIVNLSQFQDAGNIRIAFISRSNFGNNIYLKDIEILSEETYQYSLQLEELVSPKPISNGQNENEILAVSNTGNLPISGFKITRQSGNGPIQEFLARDLAIPPGETHNVLLPKYALGTGLNQLEYKASHPSFDQNTNESKDLERFVVVDTDNTQVPWRQNFNNSTAISPWITINPENNFGSWFLEPIQSTDMGTNAAKLDQQLSSNSYWIGSPIFDLSVSSQASIFFDLAAGQVNSSTTLKMLASEDGGVTYEEVYRKTGSELTTVSTGQVNPNSPTDYNRERIDITGFAGLGKTKTRVAFVLEGGDISNEPIYLDNIELFLSADEEPVDPGLNKTIIFPNPALNVFNVAFNLQEYETVNIQIFSATGSLVHHLDYSNTLNQTYSFSTDLFSKGLFIIKINSNSITETRKLVIH